jgi:hypothetical protein
MLAGDTCELHSRPNLSQFELRAIETCLAQQKLTKCTVKKKFRRSQKVKGRSIDSQFSRAILEFEQSLSRQIYLILRALAS